MKRIVVCAREVLDPDAVNACAVAGRLAIGADGRSIATTAIMRLMNGYDEQAIGIVADAVAVLPELARCARRSRGARMP